MEEENVWEKGVLVNLDIGAWGARKKLPKGVIDTGDTDENYIKSIKHLIDKEKLKSIRVIRSRARRFVYDKSLPFPMDGVWFIPRGMIVEVDNELKRLRDEFEVNVEEFVSSYDKCVEDARENLGSLYNPTDYPTDIRYKFYFGWNFITVSAPNGKVGILSPELYERESQKFRESILQFKGMVLEALTERFSELVNHIVDRLSGGEKKFRDATINNMLVFINSFDEMNIVSNEELREQVKRVRGILVGADISSIRNDDKLREHIQSKMDGVKSEVDNMLVKLPKRKIQIPDKVK